MGSRCADAAPPNRPSYISLVLREGGWRGSGGGSHWVAGDCRLRGGRYGPPNDEALENHPLWGDGLGFYAAHQVENSSWLPEWRELALIKGAQASALPQELRHFIFTFHDETVEVLAHDLNAEVFSGSMTEALQEACRRLA